MFKSNFISISNDNTCYIQGICTKIPIYIFPNYIVGVIMMKLFCRGLKFILSKWENAGFGRDLREMMMMLQAGNAKQAESEVIHNCSIIIVQHKVEYVTIITIKEIIKIKNFHS